MLEHWSGVCEALLCIVEQELPTHDTVLSQQDISWSFYFPLQLFVDFIIKQFIPADAGEISFIIICLTHDQAKVKVNQIIDFWKMLWTVGVELCQQALVNSVDGWVVHKVAYLSVSHHSRLHYHHSPSTQPGWWSLSRVLDVRENRRDDVKWSEQVFSTSEWWT